MNGEENFSETAPSNNSSVPPETKEPVNRGNGAKLARYAVLGAVAALIVIGLYRQSQPESPSPDSDENEGTLAAAVYTLKDQLQKSVLVSGFENTVLSGKPSATFDRKLAIQGKFRRGYLYIKAAVGGKTMAAPDDVYANLTARIAEGQYETFGGHLIASRTLEAPVGDTAIELLYDLTAIPYKERYYETEGGVKSGDWLAVLNNFEDQRLYVFTSTVGDGRIEELSLSYECEPLSSCTIGLPE